MEDRNKKYRIVKIAMILSALLLIGLFAIITFFESASYEDLDEIINRLSQINYNEMFKVEEVDGVSWAHRPSLILADRNNYFEDPENILRYTVSLAIIGDMENFYYQFDPSIRMNDFPEVFVMNEEQERLFNLFTRDYSLEGLRIISINGQPLEESYRARIELSYRDGYKKKIIILLGKSGDEHSHFLQWYIVSSMHDIVDQLK